MRDFVTHDGGHVTPLPAPSYDKAAGTKGAQARLWVAFSDAAAALLDSGEDAFSLVAHLVPVTDDFYERTLGPPGTPLKP